MIYITGDTHGYYDFWKLRRFADSNPQLNKNDYMLIAGDFGGLWDPDEVEESLAPYEELPFTVLFIDGNHENFDLLGSFPVEEWHGGKVHIIRPDIIHLMRGQVFDILGKTYFTFGGATSIDKWARKEGTSWWKEELPSDDDMREAKLNLTKVNYKVDYIITHACDERALYYPPLKTPARMFKAFPENDMLSYFEEAVEYKHWYFGHYHEDGDINNKKTALYNDILPIE